MKKNCIAFLLLIPAIVFAQAPNPSYFPIAVWLQSPSNAMAYKKAGINMYVGLWNELDQPQLTALSSAGMKVICAQNVFGLSKLNDTLIYGWSHGDEPDNAQWNATTNKYDPCIAPSIIINDYNKIKASDPSRPVYLNLGQGVSYTDWIGRGTCTGKTEMYPDYNNGYLKGCDIASYDIYPVNNPDAPITGKLWYVPKGIDSLKLWSSNKKPVWCWIECTKIDAKSPAKPNTDQVKSQVWMAIIHGAKGFGYFCHSWTPSFDEAALLHDATMLSAVKNINNEVTSLAPVLNSATTTGYATISSSNTVVPVDMITKNQGGTNFIFAVAMRPGTTTATFTVNSGSSVEVLGENRVITISGGKFTDNFSAYGVHLYKIAGSTGIKDAGATNGAKIYPNPFSEVLTIALNTPPSTPFDFMLYNLSGSVVYEKTTISVQQFFIKKEKLQKGMYFYVIKNTKQGIFSSGKIIIE